VNRLPPTKHIPALFLLSMSASSRIPGWTGLVLLAAWVCLVCHMPATPHGQACSFINSCSLTGLAFRRRTRFRQYEGALHPRTPRTDATSATHALTQHLTKVSRGPANIWDDDDGDDFDDEHDVMREPSEEILNVWEQDKHANEILTSFQSAEVISTNMMTFRDVYRLFEVIGIDRQTFVATFTAEDYDDEYDDDDDDDEYFD